MTSRWISVGAFAQPLDPQIAEPALEWQRGGDAQRAVNLGAAVDDSVGRPHFEDPAAFNAAAVSFLTGDGGSMTRPEPQQIDDIARRLYTAEQIRTPIRQLSLEYPDMTVEDAYAVQCALVALKVADGRKAKGRKIGLTSKVLQRAVSIDEPDYGALFDDMFFEDGGRVPSGRFIRPRWR